MNERARFSPYTVSFDSLSFQETEHERYNPGNQVTRQNYASFVIHSFRVSEGNLGDQYTYLEWMRLTQGFDFRSTFLNFLDAGGWKCFSAEERRQLANTFLTTGAHRDLMTTQAYTEEVIGQKIEGTLEMFALMPESFNLLPRPEILKDFSEAKLYEYLRGDRKK